MGLIGKGKFRKEQKSETGRLTIPSDIVKDSQFPLKEGDVSIRIVEEPRAGGGLTGRRVLIVEMLE